MKTKSYTIRLTEKMYDYIINQAKENQMAPAEYFRHVIQKDMEQKRKENNNG